MNGEPTYEELRAALNNLAQCVGIAGSEAEARMQLRTLRERKFTWYGAKENELRYAIDMALKA